MVIGNKCLIRVSNDNTFSITSTGNVLVSRWVIPLVIILHLGARYYQLFHEEEVNMVQLVERGSTEQ